MIIVNTVLPQFLRKEEIHRMSTEHEDQTLLDMLTERMRNDIKQGKYGVAGQGRIPTVTALMKQWNTTRNTVGRVLLLLQSEGIIRSKGTSLVVNWPALQLEGLTKNFEQYLRDKGFKPEMENLISPSIEETPPDIAALFGHAIAVRQQLVHRMRKQSADDVPLRIAENWYPASLAAQFVEQMQQNEHMDVLQAIKDTHGLYITTIKDVLIARIPTEKERVWLDVVRTEPIVEIRRSNFSEDGTPIMFNRLIHVAPSFTFTYEYQKDYWR